MNLVEFFFQVNRTIDQILAPFDTSAFLAQSLANCVSLPLKRDNSYYHNQDSRYSSLSNNSIGWFNSVGWKISSNSIILQGRIIMLDGNFKTLQPLGPQKLSFSTIQTKIEQNNFEANKLIRCPHNHGTFPKNIMNINDGINMQLRFFLQINKSAGWNKCLQAGFFKKKE